MTPPPPVKLPDGVVVFRFAAPLFFANATTFRHHIQDLLDARPVPDDADNATDSSTLRWLVLHCEAITDIDVTGSQALDESLTSCHDRGVTVVVCRLRQNLARHSSTTTCCNESRCTTATKPPLQQRSRRGPPRTRISNYAPSSPIAVACCTASLRDETPSFR